MTKRKDKMYWSNNNSNICSVISFALLVLLPQDAVSKTLLSSSDQCLVSKLHRRQCWDSVMLSASPLFTCQDVEALVECGTKFGTHCKQEQEDRKSIVSTLISMFGNQTGCKILEVAAEEGEGGFDEVESRTSCTREELSSLSAQAEFCAELEVSLIEHQIRMDSISDGGEEEGQFDLCAALQDVETNCVEWIFGRCYLTSISLPLSGHGHPLDTSLAFLQSLADRFTMRILSVNRICPEFFEKRGISSQLEIGLDFEPRKGGGKVINLNGTDRPSFPLLSDPLWEEILKNGPKHKLIPQNVLQNYAEMVMNSTSLEDTHTSGHPFGSDGQLDKNQERKAVLNDILDVVFDYQDIESWNPLMVTAGTQDEIEKKGRKNTHLQEEGSEFQLSSESPFAGYPYVLTAALLLTCVIIIAVIIKVKIVAKF